MPRSKQSKKTASKTVSRNVASSNPRLLQILVGLLLVLALGFLGTFVYTKWKESDLKAKATRWTKVTPYSTVNGLGDQVKFTACKQYQGTPQELANDAASKKAKVTVVASKPADLKYDTNTSSSKNGQPSLWIESYTKSDSGKAGYGHTWWSLGRKAGFSNTWWANTVTTASMVDVADGSKISMTVGSDKGRVAVLGSTVGESRNPFRLYYAPPTPNAYSNANDYIQARTAWERNTPSLAKIINCEGTR